LHGSPTSRPSRSRARELPSPWPTRSVSDTTTAHQHYRTALALTERLAAADPGNAGYQRATCRSTTNGIIEWIATTFRSVV
jgi:hypothetical protein